MSVRKIRALTELLGLMNRGKLVEKLNEHLMAAKETLESLPGDKGQATITLKLTLLYEGGRYELRPEIKSKLPEEKAFAGTTFWAVDDGFSVQHPSQMDMDLQVTSDRSRNHEAG